GVPQDVELIASTPVNFGSSTSARTARGTVTLFLGSSLALSTAAGGDLNVGGSFVINSGGTLTAHGRTVTFNAASGTQSLISGNQSFANIGHATGSTVQLVTNNLTATGTVTNSAGIFDLNALNASVG